MRERRRSGRTAFARSPGSPRRAGAGSTTLHLRGALFAERFHALSVVVGAARAVLKVRLVIEELGEPARHSGVEPLLRERKGFGGPARERLRELAPFRGELGVRPYARDQSDAKGFLGR